MKILRTLILITALTLVGCKRDFALLGLVNQDEYQTFAPTRQFQEQLISTMEIVQDSALKSLQAVTNPKLSRVIVGLGVEAMTGLGPVQFGGSSKFNLIFKKEFSQ